MTETTDIKVTKVEHSRLPELDLDHIPFGKYFTDHMLEADYESGEWKNVEIKPYQPLLLDPSLSALHYGQAIFEGLKAFKDNENNAYIFRPFDNYKRFNISATRMNMPNIPEEIFIEGIRQLVAMDKSWIPEKKHHSLYVRPVMFATDTMLGVKPSETYKFLIILSPTGPYHSKPMKIAVEEVYTRAAPGGVGFSKNAGNYGKSMLATTVAHKNGYDQVLWTDAFEHKWLQEVGMMNVFFVINNVVITPSLEDGTILEGITRDSIIIHLKEMDFQVEERKINIDELIDAYNKGTFQEVFGTGTAATVSYIEELRYKDIKMCFNTEHWKIAPELKRWLTGLREGRVEDKYGWMVKV